MFVIVAAGEQPDPPDRTSFASISSDNIRDLFGRARSMGLELEHDVGFVLARFPPAGTAEQDLIEETVRSFGRSMGDVRGFLIGRARGVRGVEFIDRRAWVPEFGAFGKLKSCGNDGDVEVTYERSDVGQATCFCRGDRLLIVDVEEPAPVESPEQKSEAAWRGLLRRAFGR